MDKSIVAVEESHRRSDPLASAPKHLGSLVQINSIAIDLSCSMEEIESPVHEHFSIRGFVAGMRRKDRKSCSPFASEGRHDNDEDLPPLSVPKFRWWQCSNCFPDIATPQMLLTDRSDPGTSSCPNVAGENDGSFSHSVGDIGGEHGSKDSIYREDNNPSNKVINLIPRYNAGHKTIKWIEEKTVVRYSEGGSSACIKKAYGHNNNADASDTVRISEIPSIRFNEPENALPQKRKPKLRSLADIMEEEKCSTSQNTRRSASSNGIQVISLEKEADSDPQLQLDAPTDNAPGNRKRKSIFEEDRGSLETTSPAGTAKRLKGPILCMEKTGRVAEVSDSESGGNRSARSDLQLGGKTPLLKPKRKMKQADITNRTGPIRDGPKKSTGNLQKRVGSSETRGGNTGNVSAAFRGETAPYLNSFISGKQVDRINDVLRSKRPEVEREHSPLIPPKKSFLGDCNVSGKVALNLSLNSYTGAERSSNSQTSCRHRGIPDLNESFTEKPSLMQENRSSTLHGNLIAREGKRQVGPVSGTQAEEMHNNVENGGNSDDIPMEIVELLAKNQRERALGNSRVNYTIGGSPSVCMEGRPNMIDFSFTNARSGISVPSGKAGPSQGILNYPQARNCRLDISNQDEGQFGLFRPSQQKRPPLSASNSFIPMSGSRPTEGDDLLWPPWRKEGPLQLNRSVQPKNLGMHSFSDQQCKGKGIGDTKSHKERRIGPSSKSSGSLDAYSNDTIPAMQLLSLMDRGIVTGSSFKVGPNSYLDKPFSPCNHHPRLNRNERQNDPFPGQSFFSQTTHTKDFPTLLNGVRFPGENFKKSYAQGQMHLQPANSKALHSEGPSNRVIQPSRGIPPLEICTLNRNPADFSIPDAKNVYTISAKDLKSRKRTSLKERRRGANMDIPKRDKVRKDASGKELSRK